MQRVSTYWQFNYSSDENDRGKDANYRVVQSSLPIIDDSKRSETTGNRIKES